MSLQLIATSRHTLQIRGDVEPIYDTQGRLVSKGKRAISAEMIRGGAPPWAREIALNTLEFDQMPMRGVARESWVCWYDSEDAQLLKGWSDEERQEIEDGLREALAKGQLPGVHVVEPPRLAAPWPAYDKLVVHGRRSLEMVVAKIAEKVREDGYDAGQVAAYERANLNRPEVLQGLADLAAVEPEEELIDA